jgi:hypothetical protein
MGGIERWFALLVAVGLLMGCAPTMKKPVSMEALEPMTPPSGSTIKASGVGRSFDLTNYDQVWDALIVVMMQNARISYLSKKTGVLCTSDNNILAENTPGKEDTVMVYIASQGKRPDSAKEVLDKLATQLYSGNKWKYFSKEKKK